MRLRWTNRAERDLEEIAVYIGQDSPAAAARVILEIIDLAEQMMSSPAIGRPGRIMGTRELVIGRLPYIIPYRVRGSDVEILRVLHASRRWPNAL